MKTKLSTILVAIAIVFSSSLFANATETIDKTTVAYSVDSYIAKIKLGYNADFANILSDNVKFNIPRNGKILTHGKKEELAFLAKSNNIVQQCNVTSTVLVSTSDYSLVKVSSVYSTFVREDYVTLIKTKNKWEITDVTTAYNS